MRRVSYCVALLLALSNLTGPAFNTLAFAPDLETLDFDPFHAWCIFQEGVAGHAPRVGPLFRHELQHGHEELPNLLGLLLLEVVFLLKNVG